MITRKQAAELLGTTFGIHRRGLATLEAVYSAADGPTREVLNAHPDLRAKAALADEARVQMLQSEQDYKRVLSQIRLALDGDTERKPSDGDDDAEAMDKV